MGQFIIDAANFMWGSWMIVVLLGFGLVFTIVFRFPQRRIGDAFRITFRAKKSTDANKKLSSWQSVATAIGGQVGSGNVVGPATAILLGGPGALFWLWISAITGQGVIMAEALGAQLTRKVLPDGSYTGGPANYIKAAFKNSKLGKILAATFAVFFVIAYPFGTMLLTTNSIAGSMQQTFGIEPVITGIVAAVLVMLVVVGGMKRIADTATTLVPVMAIVYIAMALIVIIARIDMVPEVIKGIIVSAFSSEAVLGGTTGYGIKLAMRYGIARGLLSNEAGEGSTPHVHAVADVKHPGDQALASMVTVFIDSICILSASAFSILVTGAQNVCDNAAACVPYAFTQVLGPIGGIICTVALAMFCFTTLVTGYFYGELNVKNFFGSTKFLKPALIIFTVIEAALIVLGSVMNQQVAWSFSDLMFSFAIVINLVALGLYLPKLKASWNEYESGGTTLDTTLNDIRRRKAEKKSRKAV